MTLEDFSKDLPNDLKIHLDMIARKMAENHASVMVGAGFSKNAELISPDAPGMPSLSELKAKFQTKLDYNDNQNEKNVSQLAEEFETKFGEKGLEEFIKNNIQDESFIPGGLRLTPKAGPVA